MVLFLLVLFLALAVVIEIKQFKALVNFFRDVLGKDKLD